jgi:hypothetical protein
LVVLRPFVIRVMFADGSVRDVDLEDKLRGPIFEPLKDPLYFARAFLDELGAVEWPSGASIAPESLYRAGKVLAEAPSAITPTA